MNHFYALILAGGKGTRLWPLSQRNHPKAVLTLFGKCSLFQDTIARLEGQFSADQIFVVAHPELCTQFQAQTPSIPSSNFIHEPSEKNSGPALALAALHIAQRDPNAIVAVFSVDHHILDNQRLHKVLYHAAALAADDWIVTLGIPPYTPETRFGYIQCSTALPTAGDFSTYNAQAFIEKPDSETAKAFLDAGNYFWDSGILVLKTGRIISEFDQQQPTLMHTVRSGSLHAWDALQPISLDYAIMQAAKNILVIEAQLGWNDVGNWDAVFDTCVQDACGNVVEPQHILINTRHTYIHSPRKVLAIGLDDLIIVEADEGLLICKCGQSEQVRAAFNGSIP